MPVDNALYERDARYWWSEDGHLALLACLIPARLKFLAEHGPGGDGSTLAGKRVLDVGCGGGFFSEELARIGFTVGGIDPSAGSIEAARGHAAAAGFEIDYRVGTGEQLPYDDDTFDVVVCCDVLEHVDDLDRVVRESARVLRPGGLYLYDTINRTWLSKLFLIQMFQEWAWTRLVPRGLHDWERFIRPAEMETLLGAHGLEPKARTGLAPHMGPLASGRRLVDLWRLKRGGGSNAEFARNMVFRPGANEWMNYMGCAIKAR